MGYFCVQFTPQFQLGRNRRQAHAKTPKPEFLSLFFSHSLSSQPKPSSDLPASSAWCVPKDVFLQKELLPGSLRHLLPPTRGQHLERALCHLLRRLHGRHLPPARGHDLPGPHPQLLPPGERRGILGALKFPGIWEFPGVWRFLRLLQLQEVLLILRILRELQTVLNI